MVRLTGLEPVRSLRAKDFKSFVSTISPQAQVGYPVHAPPHSIRAVRPHFLHLRLSVA
jgi:hypothetical protein